MRESTVHRGTEAMKQYTGGTAVVKGGYSEAATRDTGDGVKGREKLPT